MTGLTVENLSVGYHAQHGVIPVLADVTLRLPAGESMCVVGSSGAGKSTFWRALLGLLPGNASWSGNISLPGGASPSASQDAMRIYLRRSVGVIFQDSVGSLVPNTPVGRQLTRTVAFRNDLPLAQSAEKTRRSLQAVGFPDVERVMDSLPSELSGGMCQRVMISLALAAPGPLHLLIADEPLSALDSVTATQILDLLFQVHNEQHDNFIFIAHDLRIAQRFDHIAVLSGGHLVEFAPSSRFFASPSSAEGAALLAASRALSLHEVNGFKRNVGDIS